MRSASLLLALGLCAGAAFAEGEGEILERREALIFSDGVGLGIAVGDDGLFGIEVECAINGNAAEITFRANEEGRHFPLWENAYDTLVDIEITSDGSSLTQEAAETVFDSYAESPRPFELLDFLAGAGRGITVGITNAAGRKYVETFVSGSWRGLAALCGSDVGPEPLQSIGRDRTLIDEVQAAVDRYRDAAMPAESATAP